MSTAPTPLSAAAENAAEIAFWSGPGGQRWLERQALMDALLAPVSQALFDRAAARPGERVLDVGCGCGDTTIELARRVAPGGSVLGLDVSAPMLERARARRPAGLAAEFVLADATRHDFAAAQADLLFSRLGVMFFGEPVRSFANLRRGLAADARLAFACWRAPRDNPWLMVPLQEAYRHVPRLPELGPDDPGPFSLASEERVRRILGAAGFATIGLERVDLTLDVANGRGLQAAVDTAVQIGPASRALQDQPAEKHAAVRASIGAALAPLQQGAAVPMAASVWIVSARHGA